MNAIYLRTGKAGNCSFDGDIVYCRTVVRKEPALDKAKWNDLTL